MTEAISANRDKCFGPSLDVIRPYGVTRYISPYSQVLAFPLPNRHAGFTVGWRVCHAVTSS